MAASESLSPPMTSLVFNWADWFVFGIIACSMVVSFWRGFVKEAVSLATWVLAFFLAFHYMGAVALWIKPWIATKALATGVSFAVIFFSVLLMGGIINYIIGAFIGGTGLSSMDRLLGFGFGFVRGTLLVVVIVMLAQAMAFNQSSTWRHSVLLPLFTHVAQWCHPFIPIARG
ncbi:MAG: CvpA family protein [Gammaproteobacteria bacterium]